MWGETCPKRLAFEQLGRNFRRITYNRLTLVFATLVVIGPYHDGRRVGRPVLRSCSAFARHATRRPSGGSRADGQRRFQTGPTICFSRG